MSGRFHDVGSQKHDSNKDFTAWASLAPQFGVTMYPTPIPTPSSTPSKVSSKFPNLFNAPPTPFSATLPPVSGRPSFRFLHEGSARQIELPRHEGILPTAREQQHRTLRRLLHRLRGHGPRLEERRGDGGERRVRKKATQGADPC